MRLGQFKNIVLRALQSILGPAFVNARLMDRNVKHYKSCGLVFVHIPKNAGSSVSRALYGRSLGHNTAREMARQAPNLFMELDSFAILRDPVERAISAWKYCKFGGTSEGWVHDNPEYHSPEFETFESFATQWLPKQNPSKVDFVLQKQSEFVLNDDGDVIVSRLVMLDELAEVWPSIIEGRNFASQDLPVRNKMKQKSKSVALSDAALVAIGDFYKEDFDLIAKVKAGRYE